MEGNGSKKGSRCEDDRPRQRVSSITLWHKGNETKRSQFSEKLCLDSCPDNGIKTHVGKCDGVVEELWR
jgi:hypothetical protein